MTQTPTLTELAAEAATLTLPRFDPGLALRLGALVLEKAMARALPVVINIRTADRTLFHAALPGSAPLNDRWIRRKSNTALLFQEPSLMVGTRNREKAETLAKHGLDPAEYADHGGAVPIVVAGVGMVAVITVSGLAQLDDHRLVIEGLMALLGTL